MKTRLCQKWVSRNVYETFNPSKTSRLRSAKWSLATDWLFKIYATARSIMVYSVFSCFVLFQIAVRNSFPMSTLSAPLHTSTFSDRFSLLNADSEHENHLIKIFWIEAYPFKGTAQSLSCIQQWHVLFTAIKLNCVLKLISYNHFKSNKVK